MNSAIKNYPLQLYQYQHRSIAVALKVLYEKRLPTRPELVSNRLVTSYLNTYGYPVNR
nr:MAG TPA: hypothetical protein [Caudoviricetes sp.]